MVKMNDKTNTGEGGKGKKGRTVSDDAGGKSLSDTSTSAGVKSTVILGLPVDKDDLINYQLLIIYQLLIRTFTYQPTVDKTIVLSTNC